MDQSTLIAFYCMGTLLVVLFAAWAARREERRLRAERHSGRDALWRVPDDALDAPLMITRNGKDSLVIMSVEEYERLRRDGQ